MATPDQLERLQQALPEIKRNIDSMVMGRTQRTRGELAAAVHTLLAEAMALPPQLLGGRTINRTPIDTPYEVPAFDPGRHFANDGFAWWGWHPNYPYWSRSCWNGRTEAEARESLSQEGAIGMRVYHLKLMHCQDGAYTEVDDIQCQEMWCWQRFHDAGVRVVPAAN